MTNKEALNFIQEQKHIFGGTMLEFLEFVEPLVEKDTPKEPLTFTDYGKDETAWFCGNCRRYHIEEGKTDFCSWCGQKLDWSDEE